MSELAVPYTPLSDLQDALAGQGMAVLAPQAVARLAGGSIEPLRALEPGWDTLPADTYLKDGGSYRHRRHSCFTSAYDGLQQVAHRAHWQSLDYNALHGGMRRWFEPIDADTIAAPVWSRLLLSLGATFSVLRPQERRWFVEAHQFRIDTADGIGRPTPEGAHRDGVDFVAVILVARVGIKGGETRVFEANGPRGLRFTLDEPWSMLLLDDARMIHESTPIMPVADHGHRDTLVLTYRAGGFQGDE